MPVYPLLGDCWDAHDHNLVSRSFLSAARLTLFRHGCRFGGLLRYNFADSNMTSLLDDVDIFMMELAVFADNGNADKKTQKAHARRRLARNSGSCEFMGIYFGGDTQLMARRYGWWMALVVHCSCWARQTKATVVPVAVL